MTAQTDYRVFTRADIDCLIKNAAMLQLVGHMYCGHIGEQRLRRNRDGTVEVLTSHTPASLPSYRATPARRRGRPRKRT